MPYRLRDHVYFCWIGQVPYFLDLRADRYFRLAGPTAERFRTLVENGALEPGDAVSLVEAGAIVACDEVAAPMTAAPARPCSEALFDRPARPAPPLAILVQALVDLFVATFALRFRSLSNVFASLARRKASSKRVIEQQDIEQIASAYQRIDLLFSPEKRCLKRSVAMSRTMLRRGGGFDLVVGVRSGPFGAHCWLMRADLVLNDRMDKVREFTPILVL